MADFAPLDIVALAWFVLGWVGFNAFADHGRWAAGGLSAAMAGFRRRWMDEMLGRELRMVDTQILATLQHGIGFFASTSILVVGGLIAVLGAADQAIDALSDLPFAVNTSRLAWEIKIMLMVTIFVYAFFKFARAFRLTNYFAVLVGAAPAAIEGDAARAFADHAAALANLAARHTNRGLRAYFFGLAALGWFLHPAAFMITTAWVLAVMYRREFASKALVALKAAESEIERAR